MTTWQPIETAPRDGTAILIYQPDYEVGGERECERANFHWRDGQAGVWYDDHRYAIGYWRPWGGWGNRNNAHVNPTHWMPLPPVPTREPVTALSVRAAKGGES
jgi:hypothetical protein